MRRGTHRLRVLIVYDCLYPESLGGVEHRNKELAEEMGRRGHQVVLAGWSPRALRTKPGVSVMPLRYPTSLRGRDGRRRGVAALRLAAACARVDLQGFDIVETANIPYAHLAPLAARAELRRIPLIVTWYELWGGYWRRYVGWRWPLYALTEALAAQLGDACVVLSDLTGKRLARARRRVPRHPGLLPGGIPLARIRAAARGGEPGAPLAYAGRLLREKRLDLLLVAVARLDAPEDRPLLTVIGDGPDAPRLHQLAAELGLGARVRFLGKLPSSEEVWRELGTARVAVQPSSREGFGLFPLEAMALGLPVVYCASPESAVGELVRDGIEGRQVASDPAALATELATLLADETRRAEWSAAASARAQHFDWSAIADKFEQLCYDLLEPTASGHGS